MKKSVFILIGILFFSSVITACSLNSDAAANKNESEVKTVTVIKADYPAYDTVEKLVEAADLIFSGTVTKIDYEVMDVRSKTGNDSQTGLEEASGIPYTIFEISTDKIYKGSTESDIVYVKRPGGKIGDEVCALEGASEIEVGKTYLFVTETYENSYPSLVNVTQASYDMSEDTPEAETTNNAGEDNKITLAEVMEYLNSGNN